MESYIQVQDIQDRSHLKKGSEAGREGRKGRNGRKEGRMEKEKEGRLWLWKRQKDVFFQCAMLRKWHTVCLLITTERSNIVPFSVSSMFCLLLSLESS